MAIENIKPIKTVQIDEGLRLTIAHEDLGNLLVSHDTNKNGTLSVDDFMSEGVDQEAALQKLWKTVTVKIKQSKIFKDPNQADNLYYFFQAHQQVRRGLVRYSICRDPSGQDTYHQVSLLGVLAAGNFGGTAKDQNPTMVALKDMGNFGLGTFWGLKGELMYVDGKIFQALADEYNTTQEASDTLTSPFASIVDFKADAEQLFHGPLKEPKDLETLLLQNFIVDPNMPYAFRIDVEKMSKITVRSVEGGNAKSLKEAVDVQKKFTYEGATGTIVGFYTPQYMKIGARGFHFHFVGEDKNGKKIGGHVLDLSMAEHDEIRIAADATCGGIDLMLTQTYTEAS